MSKVDLEQFFEVWQGETTEDYESERYFRCQVVELLLSMALDIRAIRERYEHMTALAVED